MRVTKRLTLRPNLDYLDEMPIEYIAWIAFGALGNSVLAVRDRRAKLGWDYTGCFLENIDT